MSLYRCVLNDVRLDGWLRYVTSIVVESPNEHTALDRAAEALDVPVCAFAWAAPDPAHNMMAGDD